MTFALLSGNRIYGTFTTHEFSSWSIHSS